MACLLQASSPDEEALVQGAAYLGYKLIERTTEHVVVEVHGRQKKYLLAATLEFNSDRKRMSIIVQTPEQKMLLMCKGADSIILARLAAQQPGKSTCEQHLVSSDWGLCCTRLHLHCLHATRVGQLGRGVPVGVQADWT